MVIMMMITMNDTMMGTMMDTMMGMMMDVMTMITMTTTNFDHVIVCFVIFPYDYGEFIL